MSRNTNPDIEASVTCGFFNSVNGDRKYNSEQLSSLFDGIIRDGIFASIGDAFVVKADHDNTISVGTGKAWFNHSWIKNDAILKLDCDYAEILQDRIDAIVIEINNTDAVRDSFIKVIKGEPSSDAAVPTLTNGDSEKVWQYPLAYIERKANSQSITQANITNMIGSDDTPFITGLMEVISLDTLLGQWKAQLDEFVDSKTEDFESKYQALKADMEEAAAYFTAWTEEEQTKFDAWFKNLQYILDGDAAGKIQNEVDDINKFLDTSNFLKSFSSQEIIEYIIKENADLFDNKPPEYYAKSKELEDLLAKVTELEEHMDYKKPLGKDGYYKYTVVINEAYAGGDPDGMVTYEDNAKMFIKGDPAWDKVFGHYPCVFKAGKEVYKLDRDDFTKKENGSAATITGADGDVMIAFPKMGYRIERMGNNVVISITDNPNDHDYKYYAWTKGTTVKDKFYFGAFEGWNDSGKLRSISNSKTPTVSQTIGTFRTQANAVGSGYNIQGWHQWVYLQCMYVMKYGNLNSQATIGVGRQSGQSLIAIGGSEKYGMDSEIIKKEYATYMTDSAHHVKCFGIEDLWANCWDWTDGFGLDSSGKALVSLTNNNFNDSKTGYTQTNAIVTGWSDSKPKSVQGTTELGFVGRLTGGGDNAYYCDSTWSSTNTVAGVGGSAWAGTACGVFALTVSDGASSSGASIGARLMYL